MSFSTSHIHTLNKATVFVSLYILTVGIITAALFLFPETNTSYPYLRACIIFFAGILLSKYFLYMIVSPWHDVKTALSHKIWRARRPNYHPKVSALVPAWNEEVGIMNTLESLLKSRYDNLEIVIVNDGSTDTSDTIIRAFKEQYDRKPSAAKQGKSLVYHYQPNAGKGTALNTALSLASGDIIMSVDADCIVMSDTIGNFVEYFRDPTVMAAVGNVKIGNTKSLVGLIQYMEFLFSFYFKKADSVMNTIYIIGGAAGAFRRQVFEKLGGLQYEKHNGRYRAFDAHPGCRTKDRIRIRCHYLYRRRK